MNRIMDNIKEVSDSIEYKTQLIGRNQRLTNALIQTRIKGILIGFIITCIIILLPIILNNW